MSCKIILGILCFSIIMAGCNSELTRRDTPSAPAKAIYVGYEIEKLKTDGRLPKEELIIVELLTFKGKRYQGRLFQITEQDMLISQGYTTKTVGQRTFKEEQLVEISKVDLMIVKMW